MSLQFLKASTADAVTLVGISKHAFDSDVEVGADCAGGPPGYSSLPFHTKMARMNCLYKLVDDDGLTVGGAVLFPNEAELNIGRIFVAPEHFRKGYGIFIMRQIEASFPDVKTFTLDTPIWNIRTNAFYQKLGYAEVRRDSDFVYYEKRALRAGA
ncbi:MAG: GNAT family N-acetyltransferase [Treponemataceae bacterium]|nr:GNAT family N-acetyltransferase [Treponemataceae bacterium]